MIHRQENSIDRDGITCASVPDNADQVRAISRPARDADARFGKSRPLAITFHYTSRKNGTTQSKTTHDRRIVPPRYMTMS